MKHQYLKNVSTLVLDKDKCTGCGVCMDVCPHAVFEIREGRASIVALDNCMECGACEQNCAFGALEVHAGVGCAAAIIQSFFTGKEPTCGCSDDDGGCC
ncbi:MAG: mercury methylation ferredoxin HgcB [Eubacteriales bacterium]